jgi:hypothetical protein
MNLYEMIKSQEPIDSFEKIENIMSFLNKNDIVFSFRRRDLLSSYIQSEETREYFLSKYGESAVGYENLPKKPFKPIKLKKLKKKKKGRGSGQTSVFDKMTKFSRFISVPFGGMNKKR